MNVSHLATVEVKDLMKDAKQILLLHANKAYLLSITRKGKLILTLADPSQTQDQTSN
ncbi:MAG: hemin uptake protein HemP [Cocleimonas sp.]|nr:hemin uptake protein HemP [Cocleimonas sp.]